MPRNGSNIWSPPPGTEATPNTTISSSRYNAFLLDLAADLNAPRPVSAGGTGAANADDARDNLGCGDVATEDVVPIEKGGTGKTTAAEAVVALGAAPLASPVLTGTPRAPTPAFGTNTTQLATMEAVQAALLAAGQRAIVSAKTAAWTVVAADRAKLFVYSGAGHTATLPAIADVTEGDFYLFTSAGPGNLTLARAGTDTIDQTTSVIVAPGETAVITKSALVWRLVQRPRMRLIAQDVKASGTDGGSAVTGGFQLRDLNTIAESTIAGASIAGSAVSLPAGRYRLTARAPAYATAGAKARLYNITDAAAIAEGPSAFCNSGTGVNVDATAVAEIILTATKSIAVQQAFGNARATDGMGKASNLGVSEIYTTLIIEKVG